MHPLCSPGTAPRARVQVRHGLPALAWDGPPGEVPSASYGAGVCSQASSPGQGAHPATTFLLTGTLDTLRTGKRQQNSGRQAGSGPRQGEHSTPWAPTPCRHPWAPALCQAPHWASEWGSGQDGELVPTGEAGL